MTLDRANATLYGKGVFTTVPFGDFGLFLWDKHWRRLTSDAARLDIDISAYNEESVRNAATEAIRENGSPGGRVRIAFLDESPGRLWASGGTATRLSIITGDRRIMPSQNHLVVSPHRVNTTSPLAGVKTCNYLEPLLSLQEARKRGFNEAIRLNERGEIASACMANVFWLNDDQLCTPSLKTGCLAGTTREFILENLECEEVEAGIEALRLADAVFVTSAGIGVVQIAEFEGRNLQRTDHKITTILPF